MPSRMPAQAVAPSGSRGLAGRVEAPARSTGNERYWQPINTPTMTRPAGVLAASRRGCDRAIEHFRVLSHSGILNTSLLLMVVAAGSSSPPENEHTIAPPP